MKPHLLIVDDDASLNQMLGFHFEDLGWTVDNALGTAEARERLRERVADLVLLDQHMPDGSGLELLSQILEVEPDLPVIMMTGVHDLDLAIMAIKSGAYDFVHKPVKTDELQLVVDRALQARRLAREVAALRDGPAQAASSSDLVGRCTAMLAVSKEIALSSPSDATVLITGESGTGKEVVARLIHLHSGRTGPFVAVNCAAIVDTLLESELFGHEKGAFTGAVTRKLGKFELSQDGTLFLDEIGELALPLQAKLLRVLQENVFERVGGNQVIGSNARIVAATNRNLQEEVNEKRFREDLLYRLNVVSIHMPPLREREDDVLLLADALMHKLSPTIHKPVLTVTDAAKLRLRDYHWPGNVRELENVLTQAMVHARNGILTPDLLPAPSQAGAATVTQADGDPRLATLDEMEASHIQRVLTHTGGHKGRSCEILGISRPALDRKIKRYQLRLP
ncbi:MAG: sigma-54-dependent Fis family transcriptional regulator [Chromatiales bacterium]|nr:sigma-54-dependent Fis family transcriptional regulator [Chromatiales bacterium]